MKRRWNYRAYPTPEQEAQLANTFGCCRLVYNGMLAARTAALQSGVRLTYAKTSIRLTQLKKDAELSFLNDVAAVPLQQSLHHLQAAFVNFFAKRAAYPTFKKKGRVRDSAEYTRNGFTFNLETQTLRLARLGKITFSNSRPMTSDPSSVTISRHPSGRYYVSLVVEVAPSKHLKTGASVGVDFGLRRLATLSNGEFIANPKFSYKKASLLAKAQRRLKRQKKGSNRYRRQCQRVARIHEKIADARKDYLHKFTTNLIKRFDNIYIEDLCFRGLLKNHKLARSLSDAGIGKAIIMLKAKADACGVTVTKVDRWFPSSQLCSLCGWRHKALALQEESWSCYQCGSTHDRDVNAARNILAVGQTVNAHGAGVRAVRTSVRKATRRRSANQLKGEHANVLS